MLAGLVGCGMKKRPGTHPARELYTGPLFRAALDYSLAHHQATYILSARYGLVHPDHPLQSYDLPLSYRPQTERELWARAVVIHLERVFRRDHPTTFVLLAGTLYVQPILDAARAARNADWRFDDPLAHLGLFDRIRWLRRAGLAHPRKEVPSSSAR